MDEGFKAYIRGRLAPISDEEIDALPRDQKIALNGQYETCRAGYLANQARQ